MPGMVCLVVRRDTVWRAFDAANLGISAERRAGGIGRWRWRHSSRRERERGQHSYFSRHLCCFSRRTARRSFFACYSLFFYSLPGVLSLAIALRVDNMLLNRMFEQTILALGGFSPLCRHPALLRTYPAPPHPALPPPSLPTATTPAFYPPPVYAERWTCDRHGRCICGWDRTFAGHLIYLRFGVFVCVNRRQLRCAMGDIHATVALRCISF